eukprot:s1205_g3.t1
MTNSVPQMSSTSFPFSSPTPSGYSTDNFVREQILTDRVNQAQSRESQYQAQVDFRRVEVLTLPNTSQRAMVVRLSHIPRFKEKSPFMGQASHSYAMLHGTTIIGAKNCLAEALVRHNRSGTYPPGDAKDPSKESVDDQDYDRAPEDVDRLRSWSRRGGDAYDEEDDL